VARFRARRKKWRWGMVRSGDAVARTKWCGGGGVVRSQTQTRGAERVGQKKPKPSGRGSVSGCSGTAKGGEGGCVATAPPPVLN